MDNSRHMDFDAFLAEANKDVPAPSLTYKSKLYELPREMPAMIIFKALQMQKKSKSDKVLHEDEVNMLQSIFGAEQFERLCQDGLGIGEMDHMIKWVVGIYRGENALEGKDSGKTKTPAKQNK